MHEFAYGSLLFTPHHEPIPIDLVAGEYATDAPKQLIDYSCVVILIELEHVDVPLEGFHNSPEMREAVGSADQCDPPPVFIGAGEVRQESAFANVPDPIQEFSRGSQQWLAITIQLSLRGQLTA